MKTVMITGATSGFGELLVRRFLAGGYQVIATGRNLQQRTEIFADLRSEFASQLLELSLDVTKTDEIQAAFEVAQAKLEGLNILINNAGYGSFGPLEEASELEVRKQMEVNFFGTVFVTQKFLPLLRKTRGQIFNFSSVFGFMGFPLTSLYCASKFAVEGLTESLRGELKPHGVQVCLIQPGGYRTRFEENISWSSAVSTSAYSGQINAFQQFRSNLTKWKPQNPMDVVDGLFALAGRSSLPLRVTFGRDARFAKIMRRILPNQIYQLALDRFFKIAFTLNSKIPARKL